jgi:hypothetical protein
VRALVDGMAGLIERGDLLRNRPPAVPGSGAGFPNR